MGLLDYQRQFAGLRINNSQGRPSPHKIALLQAVIDLIQDGRITDNRIYFDNELRNAFSEKFVALANEGDRDNPTLPFFHLRSEPFWHLVVIPGAEEEYETLTTINGPGQLSRTIAYAYLDDALFELLTFSTSRKLLSESLQQNLAAAEVQQILQVNGWDWLECEALVADYFDMLSKELRREAYSKTAHREALMELLPKRNTGAIEFKHQNVSAVLVELGQPYLAGYKPRFNYQAQLKQVVKAYLATTLPIVQEVFDGLADAAPEPLEIDWRSVLDRDIPERIHAIADTQRQYVARKQNFVEREARNRKLGERGEAFVLDYEKWRLGALLRSDLADRVEWSSEVRGDGLGYDIRSFDHETETELFIEVKTTNNAKYSDFFISENELAFSRERATQYALYRVYGFSKAPRLFSLEGSVEQHVNLQPTTFRAGFS